MRPRAAARRARREIEEFVIPFSIWAAFWVRARSELGARGAAAAQAGLREGRAWLEESRAIARAESRSLAEALVGEPAEVATSKRRVEAGARRLKALAARRESGARSV